MQRQTFRSNILRGWALGALALALPLAAQVKYIVTDLGTLGGSNNNPAGINNAGQVAGTSSLPGDTVSHAYRTAPNSVINPATDDLGTLGGTNSHAGGINASGHVAGTSETGVQFQSRAFRADPGNPALQDLGSLPGGLNTTSFANAINDVGQVGGGSTAHSTCIVPFSDRAFRTAPDSTIDASSDLSTVLGDCRFSIVFSLNASGQAVGYSAVGNIFSPGQHAMRADPGHPMVDLGTLGGAISLAWGINDAGQTVGDSQTPTAPCFHGFLQLGAAPMQDIGTLGGSCTHAAAINNNGQIVGGSAVTGNTATHAFIYSGGVMTDINTLIAPGTGWEVVNGAAINDVGQILAGAKLNGVFRGVRLDPSNVAVSILVSQIPGLGLPSGTANSLTVKLQAALASIQAGLPADAASQLQAFINQLGALVNSGRLSPTTVAPLVTMANNLIAVL